MITVGIDNGLKGGIVALKDGVDIIIKYPMPVFKGKKTVFNICQINFIFNAIKSRRIADGEKTIVVLEKSHVRPISGKRASFMTGFCYGMMQAFLVASDFKYEIIRPKDWQAEIFRGMNKSDTKQMSVMFCKRMWPNEDWTPTQKSTKESDGLTDAACMALYCYRRFK